MYNEEQKKRYLDTLTEASKIKAETAFKRVGPFEQKTEIDCACFSAQEIVACFKQMNSSSINTIRNIKSALSVYADWCKDQNLLPDGINHYREISHQNLFGFMSAEKVSKSYLSEHEVETLANSLDNAFEVVAVRMAYEGFLYANYEAAYMVSSSDIEGKVLAVGSRSQIASEALRDAIVEAEAADVYIMHTESGSIRDITFQNGGGPVFKQLYNTARTYVTMEQRRHYFERMFRRIRDHIADPFITIKKLNDSGRINAIRNFMAEEAATDAKAVFMKHKKELDLRYGEITEVGRYFSVHGDAFMAD